MSAPPPERPAPASLRLFFALLPDAAARETLAACGRHVAHETGGRATPAGNIHLTLAFLGSVARSRLPDVLTAGARAAAAGEPFALLLDRAGWFRHAGAAWFAPAVISPALQLAFDALQGALREAGFAREERAFRPHLTLARRCLRAPAAGAPPVGWRADAVALMASETRPGGPVYRVLASWRLGDGGVA